MFYQDHDLLVALGNFPSQRSLERTYGTCVRISLVIHQLSVYVLTYLLQRSKKDGIVVNDFSALSNSAFANVGLEKRPSHHCSGDNRQYETFMLQSCHPTSCFGWHPVVFQRRIGVFLLNNSSKHGGNWPRK